MMNCNSCKNLIPEDSEFCPFCGNKVVRNLVEHSDNVEPLHLYQPDALLKRAFLFLEEKLFDKADTYVEAVLNKEPENAEAYVAKLLLDLDVSSIDELCDLDEPFDTNINYKRAIRYSNEKLKERLESAHKACVASIERRAEEERLRQEEKRLYSVYSEANYYMNLLTEGGYLNAAALFRSLKNYKDSAELAKKCQRLAEEKKLDEVYRSALSCMKIQSVSNQEKAIALFKTIPDWRDSQNLILRCEQCIEKIKAQKEAERIEKERQAEIERIEKEKKVARNRKIAMIVTPIAVAIIIFLIILKNVIIPSVKYNNALDLMNDKKYEEAISVFEALDGYKDSKKQINNCNTRIVDENYNSGIALMEAEKYEEAISVFEALGGYKDSINKIKECNFAILDNKYNAAIVLIDDGKYEEAYTLLLEIGDYRDSNEYLINFRFLDKKTSINLAGDVYIYERTYDCHRNVIKEVQTRPNGDVYFEEYSYDEELNLIKEIVTRPDGSVCSLEYNYDLNGHITAVSETTYEGDVYIHQYNCDNAGNVIKMKEMMYDGGIVTWELTYDDDVNLIGKYGTVEGKFFLEWEYTYDGNGNVLKETVNVYDGSEYTTEYVYDENGNLIIEFGKDLYGEDIYWTHTYEFLGAFYNT